MSNNFSWVSFFYGQGPFLKLTCRKVLILRSLYLGLQKSDFNQIEWFRQQSKVRLTPIIYSRQVQTAVADKYSFIFYWAGLINQKAICHSIQESIIMIFVPKTDVDLISHYHYHYHHYWSLSSLLVLLLCTFSLHTLLFYI